MGQVGAKIVSVFGAASPPNKGELSKDSDSSIVDLEAGISGGSKDDPAEANNMIESKDGSTGAHHHPIVMPIQKPQKHAVFRKPVPPPRPPPPPPGPFPTSTATYNRITDVQQTNEKKTTTQQKGKRKKSKRKRRRPIPLTPEERTALDISQQQEAQLKLLLQAIKIEYTKEQNTNRARSSLGANLSSIIQLPRKKIVRLACRKIFRDSDKKKRGYLKLSSCRTALATILECHHLPSPSDETAQEVMAYLGVKFSAHVLQKGGPKRSKPKSGKVKQSGDKIVIPEKEFVDALYKVAVDDGNAASSLEGAIPPILLLCGRLVKIQYDERVRLLSVLWSMYARGNSTKGTQSSSALAELKRQRSKEWSLSGLAKSLTGSKSRLKSSPKSKPKCLSYEHLHEMLNDIAPEERFKFTLEESCVFLGAVKGGRNMPNKASDIDMSLDQKEFTEYILRGLNQTAESMRTFAARSQMHHKMTRVLKAISDTAMEEYRQRRQKLTARFLSATTKSPEQRNQELSFWLGELNMSEHDDAE